MPRAAPLIASLNGGEISPRLYGRADQDFYRASAKLLENVAALPHGPAERRPSTRYVAAAGVEAAAVRLFDFEYSADRAYMIEAGDQYFRFFRAKASVFVADTDAAITNGDFTAGIASWTDRSGILELPFDAETGVFTVGLVVTGGTSAATGTILAINKGVAGTGTTGTLTLSGVAGTFADNETITDTSTGSATVNIPSGLLGVAAAISHDAANGRMNLDGLADDYAWAEQAVTTGFTGTTHVLAFTVHGLAGDEIELRVGTVATGNDIVEDRISAQGRHVFAFVPGASPFYVQFRAKGKTVAIDDVSLLDNVAVQLVGPYPAADLGALRKAQSFNEMYLVGADHRPAKLRSEGDLTWSLEDLKFIDGPYLAENPDDSKTLTLSGASYVAGAELTLSADGHRPFAAAHVGAIWRLAAGADNCWVTIKSVEGGTSATVIAEVAVPGSLQATATASWREGLWSDYRGWPVCVTFHEDRLVFGGSAVQPWRVDGSASGLYQTFTPGTAAGDAIVLVIANNQANAIRWLVSTEDGLLAGTSAGVMRLDSNDGAAPLSATDAQSKPITGSKASASQAIRVHEHTVFVGRHGKRLRSLMPAPNTEARLKARDVSLRADHLPLPSIEEIAWQETPWSIVWARRSDGVLLGFTYLPDEEVAAWHRHPLGPTSAGATVVESIAVAPGANQEELWLVAKRTIDGNVRRYIEVLEDWRDDGTAQEDHFYVDSGISWDGAPALVFNGADHLEGESVQIYADGGPRQAVTVTGGQITLDREASVVHAGLAAPAKLTPVRQDAGAASGSALTQRQRIGRVGLLLHRTAAFKVGRDENNLETVPLNAGMTLGEVPALFSGATQRTIETGWPRDGDFIIVQDQPTALCVVAMVLKVQTNE